MKATDGMGDGSAERSWKQEYLPVGKEGYAKDSAVQDFVADLFKEVRGRMTKPIEQWRVLDVGCGQGQYSAEISKHVKEVVAVEPYKEFFDEAVRVNQGRANVRMVHGPIEDVQLSGEFDLAISLTTIEHMPHARRSMETVIRHLVPGGFLYLTAPNKYWPIECHYKLPFLSWLPLPLANQYMRLMGKGESYESCSYMRSYKGMFELFRGLPCRLQFVTPDPDSRYLGAGQSSAVTKEVRRLGILLIRKFPALWAISKGFIVLIQKDAGPQR